LASSNNGERENVRPQDRPLKRPPEVKATRRAIRRHLRTRTRRSLRLQTLRTTKMETDSPPTHGRYAHYRGVPIPRSRYCLLGTKRTLPQAIIQCREIMRTVRENGRQLCCGRCVDALIEFAPQRGRLISSLLPSRTRHGWCLLLADDTPTRCEEKRGEESESEGSMVHVHRHSLPFTEWMSTSTNDCV